MPYIELPTGRAYYTVAGEATAAPPAVLIHGAGGSHLDWPPALRRLPGRLTIALDLPGHGRSSPPGRQTVGEYREWVVSVLAALPHPNPSPERRGAEDATRSSETGGVHSTLPSPLGRGAGGEGRFVLIGHSMGAAIALDIALHAPALVAGLVLIGAGGCLPVAPALLAGLQADPERAIARICNLAYGPNFPDEIKRIGRQRMGLVAPATLCGDFQACDRFDARSRLGEIAAPTLLIVGSEDRMTPPRYSEELRAGLPRAELLVVPAAGHMVTFEQAEEVAAAVETFLRRLDASET